MEEICSNCAARGVEPARPGLPTPDALCENPASNRYAERVGYHGTGCAEFVKPSRFHREEHGSGW